MLSRNFARELTGKRGITFQNKRYYPSAFQIRYKGYKGMLMVNPALDLPMERPAVTETPPITDKPPMTPRKKVHFRASMKKFKDCPDDSFSILDYAKPFTYACLNGELVTLLSCLGISDEIFLKKQKWYFEFLEKTCAEPQTAFKYFCYKSDSKSAEEVLLSGLTDQLTSKIKKLTREEWHGTYKKNDPREGNERVRIMIPDSRILFGVCDYTGTLQEGECHVRITTESNGHQTLDGGQVIVSRNPCLHPGDIQKFRPVECEVLAHLVDVIVFPIVGKRDPAGLMSGGDLDGDKFFVSWDIDLIPDRLFEAYGYPSAKETVQRDITFNKMVEYFANYNNSSLGRVKNLYLDWCRANPTEGAGSKECQQLNALFSSCVDGERIMIPDQLQNPPKPKEGDKKFIIDILCENVKKNAEQIFRRDTSSISMTTKEVLEELLASTDMKMVAVLNEYDLYLMTLHWCGRNKTSIEDFINYFDFGAFTTPQKHAILGSLTGFNKYGGLKEQYIGPIFNALHQSDLLTRQDLRNSNLHDPRVRWQKLYSSYQDGGLHLTSNLEKAFENFDKKILVFEVDVHLRVGIYIPKRIEKYKEVDVGMFKDMVKLFAFETDAGHFYRSIANKGYLLHFDGEIFQLFKQRKPNTFVWFALNAGYAERNKINSSSEFKVSIALQKFDSQFSKSRSRVTKQQSNGIEIYVISNRDRVGHQILDNTWNQVQTREIVRNLENTPKDYTLTPSAFTDWTSYPKFCELIIGNGKMEELLKLNTIEEFDQLFKCCFEFRDFIVLFKIMNRILDNFSANFSKVIGLQDGILSLMSELPTLSIMISQALTSVVEGQQFVLPPTGEGGDSNAYFFALASALILSTNEFRESAIDQFRQFTKMMSTNKAEFTFSELIKLVKLILFTVRDTKLAEDFFSEIFEQDSDEVSLTTAFSNINLSLNVGLLEGAICKKYGRHFLRALAADYLSEVQENCPCDFWGLPIGAEDTENTLTNIPRNHLDNPQSIADFFPPRFLGGNSSGDAVRAQASGEIKRPEPIHKCLEIKMGEKQGVYEAILRTDVSSSAMIRNEDHIRFCASKRSSDKSRQRVAVFDAIVISITRGKLEFRILQKPVPAELTSASWNVYYCTSTTNFSTMCSAIYKLIELKSEATSVSDDILELRHPSDDARIPKVEISLTNHFNESQTRAVKAALNNSLTLIWGPPGTGKTTVVVEVILNFLRVFPSSRILVSASTHNAVDNVMERFLKERAKGGNTQSEDAIRLTSDISKVAPGLKKWTLDAFVGANIATDDKAKGKAAKKMKEAVIVFSTCSGAGVGLLRSTTANNETSLSPCLDDADAKKKAKKKKKAEEKFDVVIVDEASQITEPNAIIPIVKSSKYVILVGDHVQLRPTVTGESAKMLGLETSLFERLYTSEHVQAEKIMLNVQYRMHPMLSKFSSDRFYEGKLLSGVTAENRVLPGSSFPWPGKFPFVFIRCSSPESCGSPSKSNEGQGRVVVQVVKMLRTLNDTSSIIILTPYTRQVKVIQDGLKSGGTALGAVEVNTIDGFQGREADIIIFSTVRANFSQSLGFLDDSRRMNVAVTRARFGLIVVGDEDTLSGNVLWKALIDYAKKVTLTPTGGNGCGN